MKKITDVLDLANQFMGLNAKDFRMFWAMVGMEWNQEDGDLEAQWFYYGKNMTPLELTVIGAMHQALLSGQKSERKQ